MRHGAETQQLPVRDDVDGHTRACNDGPSLAFQPSRVAIGRLALRQAPLRRREQPTAASPDTAAAARIAEALPDVKDENLRQALGRLGAAIKRN